MTEGLKTKLKKIFFSALSGLLFPLAISAQDVEFSQFYAAPLHLNPALAGISYGPRFNINYRNQWPNINKGYVTYALSYDQHIDKLKGGVGVALHADRIAGGVIQQYVARLMYSYQWAMARRLGLKIALSGGVIHQQLDWNKLTFQDQIDPIYGFVNAAGQPNATAEAPPYNNRLLLPDFGTGIVIFTSRLFSGVSIHHLNAPRQSFYERNDYRLPLRISFQGGYVCDLTPRNKKDEVSLSPNILLVQQSNFSQLNAGAYFDYDFIRAGLFFRHTLRNSDALIAMLGFRIEYLRIAYSFDFTLSKMALNSGGAHEVSLVFNWRGDNNSLMPKGSGVPLLCPSLLRF